MSTIPDDTFVNRNRELAVLRRAWDSDRAELLVVWGRRRVGKTALLNHFAHSRRGLVLTGDTQREAVLLRRFARLCGERLGPPGIAFADWDGFFAYIGEVASAERLLLVLDEVGFLNHSSPAFYTILQRAWETQLTATHLKLVLCGSAVSSMEREVLGAGSPLYGRRTGQLEIKPMDYRQARDFFPECDESERLGLYALAGGVPAYLRQLDPTLTPVENVVARVFPPEAFLHLEPRLLLLQELREPSTYFAVLEALAAGARRFSEIADRAYLPATRLSKYLNTLQQMRLVERDHSVTQCTASRGRSRYRLADLFFKLWFGIVAPWAGVLESPDWSLPRRELARWWPHHVARAFERVCRQLVAAPPSAEMADLLGGPYQRVGAWWERREEIDVAAVGPATGGRRKLLLGECKWSAEPVGVGVLESLTAKVARVTGRWSEVRLALFARSGFTVQCREAAALVGEGSIAGRSPAGVALVDAAVMSEAWEVVR